MIVLATEVMFIIQLSKLFEVTDKKTIAKNAYLINIYIIYMPERVIYQKDIYQKDISL